MMLLRKLGYSFSWNRGDPCKHRSESGSPSDGENDGGAAEVVMAELPKMDECKQKYSGGVSSLHNLYWIDPEACACPLLVDTPDQGAALLFARLHQSVLASPCPKCPLLHHQSDLGGGLRLSSTLFGSRSLNKLSTLHSAYPVFPRRVLALRQQLYLAETKSACSLSSDARGTSLLATVSLWDGGATQTWRCRHGRPFVCGCCRCCFNHHTSSQLTCVN